MNNFSGKVNFIWSVADLLRGPYRPNQYKDVMLPMTVLRRLDCVLEPTKDKVLAKQKSLSGGKVKNVDPILCRVTGVSFYNTSRYSFEKLKGDPNNIATNLTNLTNYIKGFSTRAREIIENFGFEEHIGKIDKADRPYLLVSRFCDIDLHPQEVSNLRRADAAKANMGLTSWKGGRGLKREVGAKWKGWMAPATRRSSREKRFSLKPASFASPTWWRPWPLTGPTGPPSVLTRPWRKFPITRASAMTRKRPRPAWGCSERKGLHSISEIVITLLPPDRKAEKT